VTEQLLLGQIPGETRWQRGRREKAESVAIDPSAGEIGAERNLVYLGPRGDRGFPLCETDGCRREAIGPYAYACGHHWDSAVDEPSSQLRELPGDRWEDIFR
jgi:hypothetical protein